MSRAQDDFEEPSFVPEGTEETVEATNLDEIEITPISSKTSISKKAAKKRDARRRIEDYMELKRVKAVTQDYGNEKNTVVDLWNWVEENASNNP